jgi:serine/threonine-protein kinase
VESHLGEGGMGAVYKAEHIAMAQPVAIKVLLTETANDPSMVKRFIREARSCFRIDHPNCVRVTDFGAAENGALYFAMEYLDGRTMGIDLHVDGAMSSARIRHIGAQVADALHHAHGLGLIHRDLKPGNIMLLQRDGDPDFVKVFDFGLGKLVDEGARLTGLTMSPLTQDGIVFGTPEYMSPEQATGQTLGPASDVYTLGVCCYEMLTEHLPFSGKTFTETLSKHVTEAPVPPSVRFPELAIDGALEDLVMRCLEKEPAKRPTASALAAGLRSVAKDEPRASPVIASSETLLVSEASMASIAGAHLEPPEPSAPSKTAEFAQRRKPRILVFGGIAILLLALGGLGLATRGSSTPAATAADAGTVDATPTRACDAASPVDAAVEFDAEPPPPVTPAKRAGKKPAKPKRKADPAPDEHLRAAEKARRAGNILKQLSESNASLGVNPKGKRAAYLAGDALKRSGDKVAACKFFRRAGRQHYRAEGCSD